MAQNCPWCGEGTWNGEMIQSYFDVGQPSKSTQHRSAHEYQECQ